MGRSNTRNGGSTYFDLAIQTVSADASQYTLRAAIFLTSFNVVDSVNNLAVGGNWSRSGTLALNGVYSGTPVWFQDISFGRIVGVDQTITVNATWSTVEYWAGPLSASESYVIPAAIAPPNPPTVAVTGVTATSAGVYTTVAGAENGATTDVLNYRIHRVSDGAWMGDIQGGYGGVTFTNLSHSTNYNAYAQSHNAAGWGGFSGPANFTTSNTVPGAPTSVSVPTISAVAATVAWVAPADNGGSAITSYAVQYSTDASFSTGVVTQGNGALTNLIPGTAYTVRVRAGNAVGPSAWSVPVSFSTLTGVRLYNGSTFVQAPLSLWTGSAWAVTEVRIYNGSAWVPTG